jgi:hypothetical protein
MYMYMGSGTDFDCAGEAHKQVVPPDQPIDYNRNDSICNICRNFRLFRLSTWGVLESRSHTKLQPRKPNYGSTQGSFREPLATAIIVQFPEG